MYPAERQTSILKAAHAGNGSLSVARLSEQLEVTAETIRRDLAVLARRGLIVREHGGARLTHGTPFEISLANRQLGEAEEKARIAERLVRELPADGVVMLDSGSMSLAFASVLPDRELIVVTNNLPAIPLLLERPRLTVMALPGKVRSITQGAVDEWTRARLSRLNADIAIVGANGVSADHGLTTTVPDEADVKRAMLLGAKRRIAAVTASKIGLTSFCRFATADEVDLIVTDARIEAQEREALASAGPELAVV